LKPSHPKAGDVDARDPGIGPGEFTISGAPAALKIKTREARRPIELDNEFLLLSS
jgi:hypothetical protein